MLAAAEQHLLHVAIARVHRLQQWLHALTLGQVEVLGLEYLTAHSLLVGVLGQLPQAEIQLPGLRQRHDVVVMADQHRVAPPRHAELSDLAQYLADGHVQTDHAFEKVIAIHRGNGRHHPP